MQAVQYKRMGGGKWVCVERNPSYVCPGCEYAKRGIADAKGARDIAPVSHTSMTLPTTTVQLRVQLAQLLIQLLLLLQKCLGAAFEEGLRRQHEMKRVGESTADVEAGSAVLVWKGCGEYLLVQSQDSHCCHKLGG